MSTPGAIERLRRRASAEDGMTVWEVTVAIVILLLGMLASFQMFDAATRNTFRSEQTQVALDRAQREIEAIRALTYDQVLLTAAPGTSSDPDDPRSRVSGAQFNVNRTGTADMADLAYNGGPRFPTGTLSDGLVSPGPTAFQSGDIKGRIYRFVVWRNDSTCTVLVCPGTQDYKEVIVVVRLDDNAISFDRPYVELHTRITDPADSVVSDVPSSGGVSITAQQFWLSDTACENDGSTARVVPLADHQLHNTLGTCFNGLKTGGSDKGSPDTLLRNAPPDTDPADPGLPLPRDYATDDFLEPTPDNSDRGIQMLRQGTNGCNYAPSEAQDWAKVHRWVTDPMPSPFVMTGRAVVYFYTRAINDAVHNGRLCFYLFTRSESSGGVGLPPIATDTRLIDSQSNNPYWTFTPPNGGRWPRGAWVKFPVELRFPQATVGTGQRLGLAISVERQGTNADAIQLVYEHHLFQSRLEVDTTTPLG